MNNAKPITLLTFLLLTTALGSWMACTSDPSFQTDELLGRWEIEVATRDGQATESLAELFFEFQDNNQLLTNLSSVPELYQYEVDGSVIKQRGGAMDVDYMVEELMDGRLILTTELRNFNFRFVLNKNSATEEAVE